MTLRCHIVKADNDSYRFRNSSTRTIKGAKPENYPQPVRIEVKLKAGQNSMQMLGQI